MTTEYVNRRENLRRLIEQWGGPTSLAMKLGYSNASFLVQMAGPHPIRDVSERTARKIEGKLDLPRGSLDQKAVRSGPKVSPELLTQVVRYTGQLCQDAGIRLTPAKFADLVTIIYQDAEANGAKVREDFSKRMVALAK